MVDLLIPNACIHLCPCLVGGVGEDDIVVDLKCHGNNDAMMNH